MSFFKRALIILSLSFMLTNTFFMEQSSIKASANPLAGITLAEGGLGALGITVSAPVVAGVAGALVLAGVAWHYRDEIQGVAGWIAQNVTGAVIETGSSIYVNAKKVIDSYNSMRDSNSITNITVSNDLAKLPSGVLIKGDPYDPNAFGWFVKLGFDDKFTIPVPSGMHAYSGDTSFTKPVTLKDGMVGKYNFGRITYYNVGDKYNFISSQTQRMYLDGWVYYTNEADGIATYPPSLVRGQSVDVEFPQNLSPAKDIGNDTFVSVPKDASISADGMVNQSAKEIADSLPISVSNGQAGVSVPASKVLNPAGEIPLTGEGTISIPNTATGEGTTTGDTTAEGDTTSDLDKPISNTLDFSPILKIGQELKDIFPFCIPFDLINAIKMVAAPPVPPKFEIKFDSKYFAGGTSATLDFSQFETWAAVSRWFFTAMFIVFLILKTRTLIKG